MLALFRVPFWDTPLRKTGGGIGVWICIRLSTSFCTRHPDATSESVVRRIGTSIKQKNTDNLFDYQCFHWRKFILLVESVETSPGFFYCTGNHSVPENPSTEWSQIRNRCPLPHISNSFFNLLTVDSETLVSLATFR